MINGSNFKSKSFVDEALAARAYDILLVKNNGDQRKLNFPEKIDEYKDIDIQSILVPPRKFPKNICFKSNGFEVAIKGKYIGRTKTLDDAILLKQSNERN